MPQARVRFKDNLLLQNIVHSYPASNERLDILGELVDEAQKLGPVKKVGSICSGGEVPLQVFAPRGFNVTAIDYSRESMLWAVAKTMLIQQHEPAKVREMLAKETAILTDPDFLAILDKCRRKGLVITNHYAPGNTDYRLKGVSKYWQKLTDDQLAQIAKASSRIEFVHGCMSKELAAGGPFDLIYTSNALTFTTADGKYLNLNELYKTSLRPGGFILSTSPPDRTNGYSGDPTVRDLTTLKSKSAHGNGGSDYVNWTYYLAQYIPSPRVGAAQ
jgi:hypothetical protein